MSFHFPPTYRFRKSWEHSLFSRKLQCFYTYLGFKHLGAGSAWDSWHILWKKAGCKHWNPDNFKTLLFLGGFPVFHEFQAKHETNPAFVLEFVKETRESTLLVGPRQAIHEIFVCQPSSLDSCRLVCFQTTDARLRKDGLCLAKIAHKSWENSTPFPGSSHNLYFCHFADLLSEIAKGQVRAKPKSV